MQFRLPAILLPLLLTVTFIAHGEVLCSSSSLEPSLGYGHAFGDPKEVTEPNIDVGENEYLVFQYVEYQTREPDYAPVYGIHLLRDEKTKEGRLILIRLKTGKGKKRVPILREISLNAQQIADVLAYASPIVQQTHYPDKSCGNIIGTDGFVFQAASGSPQYPEHLQGGEAFEPVAGSDADRMVKLGRLLRSLCLGESKLASLDDFLKRPPINSTH